MDSTVQQTKAEGALVQRLKKHAKDNKKFLKEIYVEAILEAVEKMEAEKNGRFDLLSSPLDGDTLSFKIPDSLIERAKKVLKGRDSARRLYYTAFVLFDRKIESKLSND